MPAPDDDETRNIAEDGTQESPEAPTAGGRSSRGPALSPGGKQEPGGAVPPYEGRKTSAEPNQGGSTYKEGVRVGGATGAVEDESYKAPSPSDTPGGRTASPGDEQPAEDMPGGASREEGVDSPAHTPGTPKGERGGA